MTASIGTHEVYRVRAGTPKRLVAERGLDAVAVEAATSHATSDRRVVSTRLAPLGRSAGLAGALLLLAVGGASAQLAELRAGSRVRLEAPGELAGRVEGTVLDRGPDTLRLALAQAAPVPVPIASITWLAVNRGPSRRAGMLRGATRGAAVGLGLGVLNAFFSDCGGRYCETGYKVAGVATFGAIGAGAGALIGSTRRADRWDRLALPPRVPVPVPGARARIARPPPLRLQP